MAKTTPNGAVNKRSRCQFLLALAPLIPLLSLLSGCDRPPASVSGEQSKTAEPTEATVQVIRPERKTLTHRIEQPAFNIEAFQETAIYPRIAGYVRKWNVDIGDKVHKGDILAELFVPEMEVEVQKQEASVRHAEAQIAQARAAALTAQAQMQRAKSQYDRLARAGRDGVLDSESVDETRLGYEAARANLEKANADVAAAEAQLAVIKASRDYAKTMLDYALLGAPFDGVVTKHHINEGDYVQPAGAGGKPEPLFVISQTNPVRVFIQVPSSDALWIRNGDPVTINLQGAGGELFTGKVTRNARSLDPQARTLRTEVDLPNPQGKLLPGTYAQSTIAVQHANAWTLPTTAVVSEGNQTFCYRVVDRKAVRTPLQVGLRGDGRTEVLKKQMPSVSGEEGRWENITGDETIVAGDVASLHDGQSIRSARSLP